MRKQVKKIIRHHTISSLKSRFEIKTSEDIFEINKEIPLQCPRIDTFIDEIYDIERHLQKVKDMTSNYKELDKPYIDRELEILRTAIACIPNQFEELRIACENLRSRGNGWKKLAKDLFDQLPNNEKYIGENIYQKLKNK